ncbi:MAG TPA: 1,4-alpha-glucan branching enzyme, partial [Caulobacteraceae bacterium]|nr:1,4-alpha-glucan branching enzyme [Caulobacteraceae bacterium]
MKSGDALPAEATAELLTGRLSDPFAFLGPHETEQGRLIRAFLPGALAVDALSRDGRLLASLRGEGHSGLFGGVASGAEPYVLRVQWPDTVQETEDPYAFGPVLGDLDLHLFAEGAHWQLARRLGAHVTELDGVRGVAFSVWAPNARRVSVVGDFNSWDGRRHAMRLRHGTGVWELFVPRLAAGERYKFEVVGAAGELVQKADPLARATEPPPATASIVAAEIAHAWRDDAWMARRAETADIHAPVSIYEVHAASWVRPSGRADGVLDWDALAERLPAYAAKLGFSHVELMPIMEHPFGGSWGYQPLSQFAPSARFGPPEGFARFVDACHQAGVGVILDWVPGHFPTDPHGLARFDGTALYEHADPREGFHPDWNTYLYNLGRREVAGFLLASALHWIETFHVDGLRVDAVASMLYRDYSRKAGEWIPNQHGGRENLEAIAFFRRLNALVAERGGGAVVMAEESTAWPGVTAAADQGGLGFAYKWNMGWMH